MDAYDMLTMARKTERPSAKDWIHHLFDDFIELHGDRHYKDDKAIIAGIAMLDKRAVTVIGIQKGKNLEENLACNFGLPQPEGYRKALRLMKQAEKFGRPIITLINTAGAHCGVEAEKHNQAEAIARNLFEMSQLKTPIISLFMGEGGSGGALALAVADRIYAFSYAVYSIISPEGFASILWKDATRTREAAKIMKITAKDLLQIGVIDGIIKEHKKGAEHAIKPLANEIKTLLKTEIKALSAYSSEQLLALRYERFRKYGLFQEVE